MLAGITLLLLNLLSAKTSSKQVLRMTAEAGITAVVLSVEDGMDYVQITMLTTSRLHTSTNIPRTNQMAQASHTNNNRSYCLCASLLLLPRRQVRLLQAIKALDLSDMILTATHTQILRAST